MIHALGTNLRKTLSLLLHFFQSKDLRLPAEAFLT